MVGFLIIAVPVMEACCVCFVAFAFDAVGFRLRPAPEAITWAQLVTKKGGYKVNFPYTEARIRWHMP